MDHTYAEEHGLVESYLKDRLAESERTAFEAHYFDCETCIEQLETASDFKAGMLQMAAEDTVKATGLLAALALLSRRRRLAWGGVLLLLLALPLGFLIARNRGLERQLAEARTTAPGEDPRIASLEAELSSLRESGAGDRRRLEGELARERQARADAETATEKAAGRPQVNVPVFLLAAVRSGEQAGREPVNRVSLPAEAESVIFTLELATVDFPSYRAVLQTESGREIWQAGNLHPDSRDALVLLLPTRMIPPGVYRLRIEGGKGFAVGDYPFRVVR
jgi:hypothetical protein